MLEQSKSNYRTLQTLLCHPYCFSYCHQHLQRKHQPKCWPRCPSVIQASTTMSFQGQWVLQRVGNSITLCLCPPFPGRLQFKPLATPKCHQIYLTAFQQPEQENRSMLLSFPDSTNVNTTMILSPKKFRQHTKSSIPVTAFNTKFSYVVGASRWVLRWSWDVWFSLTSLSCYFPHRRVVIIQEQILGNGKIGTHDWSPQLQDGTEGSKGEHTRLDPDCITDVQGYHYIYVGTNVQFHNEVNKKKRLAIQSENCVPYNRSFMLTIARCFPIKHTTRWHGIKVNS